MPKTLPELVDDLKWVEHAGHEEPGERVLVTTIHDGGQAPRQLLGEGCGELFARPEVADAYLVERDWGANLVARHLARELGLGGYLRVNLARVVLDFGRFPGSSGPGVEYLHRKAIYPPMAGLLTPEAKHELIQRYYYSISDTLTRQVADKHLLIDVHTYDPRNLSGTDRPEVSLVNRSLEYQQTSTIPPYLYDPLFPAHLCETTCERTLVYETLLACERAGWHVTKNYPYAMPAGSVEIRAQVWFFFRYVRERFHAERPETRDLPAYQRVWQMLLDVARRSCDAQSLRGYLHRFREPPSGSEGLFAEARRAYGEVARFLARGEGEVARAYGFRSARPSCLGIEVRKDLLCEIDRARGEARLRPDAEETARELARHLAGSVPAFLDRCSVGAPEADRFRAPARLEVEDPAVTA